jgi:hypothetical protein
MNRHHARSRGLKTLAFLLAVAGIAGAAADKAAPQGPVTLAYKLAPGATLAYTQSGSQTQDMDMMGQTMSTVSTSSMELTLEGKGPKDENLLIGVTIDGMTLNVQSPQGDITPDLSGILGKSFDLVLSPLGKELDVSGAAAFTVDMGQAGRRDMTSNFQAFFPDLPGHPVKVGDTWPSEDNIVQKSDAGDVHISLKNENTFDGFETIDGRECARVKATVKGTVSGALNQGGNSLALDAKLEGTQTWHFAVKDGIFVKAEMKATMGGVISIESMSMTIGFSGEQKSTTALVKK